MRKIASCFACFGGLFNLMFVDGNDRNDLHRSEGCVIPNHCNQHVCMKGGNNEQERFRFFVVFCHENWTWSLDRRM